MVEYTAKQGDTFDSIAFEMLGNEFLATNLIEANPQYVGTVIFSGGEALKIPTEEKQEAETGLPPWRDYNG